MSPIIIYDYWSGPGLRLGFDLLTDETSTCFGNLRFQSISRKEFISFLLQLVTAMALNFRDGSTCTD